MEIFKVNLKKSSDICYYLLAGSASEAIERVTLKLEDGEGLAAWIAQPAKPEFEVSKGGLFDQSGKPVSTMEA